jgi:hypothetical protein
MVFNPNKFQLKEIQEKTPVGTIIKFKPHLRCWSRSFGVEAVTIKKIDDFFCQNRYPHITVSTDNKPPVESNSLLEQGLSLKDFETEDLTWLGVLEGKVEIR